jgi:hypothetical protein
MYSTYVPRKLAAHASGKEVLWAGNDRAPDLESPASCGVTEYALGRNICCIRSTSSRDIEPLPNDDLPESAQAVLFFLLFFRRKWLAGHPSRLWGFLFPRLHIVLHTRRSSASTQGLTMSGRRRTKNPCANVPCSNSVAPLCVSRTLPHPL